MLIMLLYNSAVDTIKASEDIIQNQSSGFAPAQSGYLRFRHQLSQTGLTGKSLSNCKILLKDLLKNISKKG